MINGAHVIVYSKNAEADVAFLRDVLHLSSIDAGGGWLIFALPPSEVAVHPTEGREAHELYLTCDDVKALVRELTEKAIRCSPIEELRWGSLTRVTLPGGGNLGIYQPKHASPHEGPHESGEKTAKSA